MGYRSDVVALIYPEPTMNEADNDAAYDQLKVLMNTTFKDVMEDFGSCMEWLDKDNVMKFQVESYKWYESYPEVQRFDAMIRTFHDGGNADEIAGYCTEFIRIGEDTDDIEESHTGEYNQYYLSVSRSVDCNI